MRPFSIFTCFNGYSRYRHIKAEVYLNILHSLSAGLVGFVDDDLINQFSDTLFSLFQRFLCFYKLRGFTLNGIAHSVLDKIFLILTHRGKELVQLTEDNFVENTGADIVDSAFVLFFSVCRTTHMLLFRTFVLAVAQIHLLSAVGTVHHSCERIYYLRALRSALVLAKLLHQVKGLLRDDRLLCILKNLPLVLWVVDDLMHLV